MDSGGLQDGLAELVARLRADIEAHAAGIDNSPAARAERRRRVLVQNDFQFFAYTYFPHHVRGEPSSFQSHFCRRLPQLLRQPGGVREWWIAPRGEAKSSLLTKVGPTWCAVQGMLQDDRVLSELGWPGNKPKPPFLDYLLLLGAEMRLPTKLLEVVKTELVFNSTLAMDFPEACGKGPLWKVGEFVTRTGMKVEPFGAEQAIRGTFHGASRPKLLLGDDLITDAEAKSKTERANRWDWLTKAIDYLGPPDGSVKFLGVGTVLSNDDPISRARTTVGHTVHHFRAIEQLPRHMDLWAQCAELMLNADRLASEEAAAKGLALAEPEGLPSYLFYLQHQAQMDAGAQTSWPSVRSLYWLMRQRTKAPRAFGTEMQGEARTDDERVFHPVTFWVNKINEWVMYGGCDPSMGQGHKSDPSSLLVGGMNRDTRVLHVEVAAIKRRVPSKLESDLVRLQRDHQCMAWGFENNNAYEHMRQTIARAGEAQGVSMPLIGLTATIAPEMRIESLEPLITDRFLPRIVFAAHLTQLLAELDTWPEEQPGHHYDGLCGLWLLYQVALRGGVAAGATVTGGREGTTARTQARQASRNARRRGAMHT